MAQAPIYKHDGTQAGEITLSDAHFGVAPKMSLVHEAVLAQRANARRSIAHTKDRGEVRGGGKKPWRQKGTGRARHGSIRSPIWRGGGITFGPRNARNFSLKINRKAKQKALFMALSDKLTHEHLYVIESWKPEVTKTRALADLLGKLPTRRTVLLVTAGSVPEKVQMSRNLERIWVTTANSLSLLDVLSAGTVIFESDAVDAFEHVFSYGNL